MELKHSTDASTIRDQKALSSTWRVNTSAQPTIEIALALQALKKVIGAVESKDNSTVQIGFNTDDDSYNDRSVNSRYSKILLSPTFATKSAPIQPEDFDVLVGLAAHEAGHSLVDSYALGGSVDLNATSNKVTLEAITTIGEEIHTDSVVSNISPMLRSYIQRARSAYALPVDKVNWADFMAAWTGIALYGQLPPLDTPMPIQLMLKDVMPETQKLRVNQSTWGRRHIYTVIYEIVRREEDAKATKTQEQKAIEEQLGMKDGTTAQENAQDNAPEVYAKPEPAPETEPSDSKSDDEAGVGGSKDDTTESDGDLGSVIDNVKDTPDSKSSGSQGPPNLLPGHDDGARMTSQLMAEVMKAVVSDTQDMTNALRVELSEHTHITGAQSIKTTVWSTATTSEETYFNKDLYDELQWVARLKRNQGREVYRGEERGTIDGRRLHRAAVDGRAFKRKHKVPRKDVKLVLLLDQSGSMANNTSVYDCASALHKVLPESSVISYYSEQGIVRLEVAAEAYGIFHTIEPKGTTPSGQALLATAMKYPDSLIVHFTDGYSNVGVHPRDTYPVIETKYPEVSVVEVQYRSHDTNESKEYIPDSVALIQINDIPEFPDALKEAIKPWYLGV